MRLTTRGQLALAWLKLTLVVVTCVGLGALFTAHL